MQKYYEYCPECGHQSVISYPTGIGTRQIDRVIPNPINVSPISYLSECAGCKGKNCGITLMEDDTMSQKVFLRSAIALYIESPVLKPEKT